MDQFRSLTARGGYEMLSSGKRESYWLHEALVQILSSRLEEPDAARLRSVATLRSAVQDFLVRENLRDAVTRTSTAALRSICEHGRDCYYVEGRAIVTELEVLLPRLLDQETSLASHIDHPENLGGRKHMLLERMAVYLKMAGWGRQQTYRLLYGKASLYKSAQTAILRLLNGDHAKRLLKVLESDDAEADYAIIFDAADTPEKATKRSPPRVRDSSPSSDLCSGQNG